MKKRHDCVNCDFMKFLKTIAGELFTSVCSTKALLILKKLAFADGVSWTDSQKKCIASKPMNDLKGETK